MGTTAKIHLDATHHASCCNASLPQPMTTQARAAQAPAIMRPSFIRPPAAQKMRWLLPSLSHFLRF